MEFQALRVAPHALDPQLTDDGQVGPELAHLVRGWRRSPRALIWRHPSSEWQRFVLLLPMVARLSLLSNPIFTQLTRAWGLHLQFIGVDRDGLAYDFRQLLSDATLRLLVECLDPDLHDQPRLLDALFAALSADMLTVLQQRRRDWGRHLAVQHRLEPQVAGTLFVRASRHPDLLAGLRAALRDERIDAGLYARALRTIEQREAEVEAQVGADIVSALDGGTLALLARSGCGRHLGAYNWLRIDPPHAPARAHVLGQLPWLVGFLAEALLPLDARRIDALAGHEAPDRDHGDDAPTEDPNALRWRGVLMRAVDAGQDRAVIEALALHFGVSDNVIRRLWRESPADLGQPPGWQLQSILRVLQARGDRQWPRDPQQWEALLAHAGESEATG